MALALARRAGANAPSRGGSSGAQGPATEGDLTWHELSLPGPSAPGHRALVLYPARGRPGQTYPGLLLFHGRGETSSDTLAIHAWRSRYGLPESDARLRRPPVRLDSGQHAYMAPAQLDALNAALARRPFTGFVVICPVTPNALRSSHPERTLARYSDWLERTVLPAASEQAPLAAAHGLGVDGCSMGGFVAAEVFLRKSHLFHSFGVVQPAFGEFRTARYAHHLGRALEGGSLRAVHLQTSTRDPYRKAVRALARRLQQQQQRDRVTLTVLPGPHDQRWLRATGTLAMLAWHDGVLSQAEPRPK